MVKTKDYERKIYLEADIKLEEETAELRKAVSSVIELPKKEEKQPDLLYFSAIFISSGENLNHAYFLPSELVKSEGTIVNKALDVEHKEEEIIGHIYAREFITAEGNKISVEELASVEEGSINNKEFHIVIAGIVYRNRFPNLSKEIADKKWKVSMEAYYNDYDVKVGDLIISRNEAESLGIIEESDVFGKLAKVIRKGKEIASGTLTRVLRGIIFSGCGVVKNPANPPSVILETANNVEKENSNDEEIVVLDYNGLCENDKVSVEEETVVEDFDNNDAENATEYNDSVGICVNFRKRVMDVTFNGPGTKILHENWCTLYDSSCTSFSRDTTDPKCLRNTHRSKISAMIQSSVKKAMKNRQFSDKRGELLDKLNVVLDKAEKGLR